MWICFYFPMANVFMFLLTIWIRLHFYFYLCVCVYICLWVCAHECATLGGQKRAELPGAGAGVTVGYELADVGPRNGTPVLKKSRKHFYHWTISPASQAPSFLKDIFTLSRESCRALKRFVPSNEKSTVVQIIFLSLISAYFAFSFLLILTSSSF